MNLNDDYAAAGWPWTFIVIVLSAVIVIGILSVSLNFLGRLFRRLGSKFRR